MRAVVIKSTIPAKSLAGIVFCLNNIIIFCFLSDEKTKTKYYNLLKNFSKTSFLSGIKQEHLFLCFKGKNTHIIQNLFQHLKFHEKDSNREPCYEYEEDKR